MGGQNLKLKVSPCEIQHSKEDDHHVTISKNQSYKESSLGPDFNKSIDVKSFGNGLGEMSLNVVENIPELDENSEKEEQKDIKMDEISPGVMS